MHFRRFSKPEVLQGSKYFVINLYCRSSLFNGWRHDFLLDEIKVEAK